VLILNESSDTLDTFRLLWETDGFDSLIVTKEDRLRHRDYSVRAVRDLEGHQDNLEAFLRSLEMEATIEEIGPSRIDRALVMIGKRFHCVGIAIADIFLMGLVSDGAIANHRHITLRKTRSQINC
jgi:hypothetical protein